MRLINIWTNKLESFTSEIPTYVILSHTWGTDSEEVTFQEMLVDPGDRPPSTTLKPGYRKIFRTCQNAQHYNLSNEASIYHQDRLLHQDQRIEHAWIDTCCIDKSSSAELSEAINSMYKYYLEAVVCFAYLSDMTANLGTFETSRWFTRGWTLQELVAPRSIRFYDKSWAFRGTRHTFRDVIQRVTHISTFEYTSELPVAVRMSWASQRHTTRVEDLAYCLMGIFDVNMPLLYGEGKKAFIRLQEEIIKQNPDLSIFAWTNPLPSMFSGLLAESPQWFRDGHELEAAPSIRTVYSEFSVTNQGIRFREYPLKYYKPTGCLVLVLGHQSRSQRMRLGLLLRQISKEFCVRVSPDRLLDEDECSSSWEMTIQVPKVLSSREILDTGRNTVTLSGGISGFIHQ
ncbi:uncharacterized protein N0V89_003269 [Didymosphaeria variabile]|uniref:HET-domain-containing protein n=1 Tax=Didymosphaeria variabile TaxID=1932322 RepID=A0A9W9CF79_9PLEO|nr:uncharacterized protein N0V89_003269 [Didymosphaeria variabile]KAJ4358685.1 hypothetical protein N0V89_003269 [Didymosphaeria variabile]